MPMNRSTIADAAVSAAKAHSHAEVEPRHVVFALARHFRAHPEGAAFPDPAKRAPRPRGGAARPRPFREHPECAAFLDPAKRALEPRGRSYGSPQMSEAARALLD